VALGERAERAEELKEAAENYRRALDIKEDDALTARLAGIERRLAVRSKIEEADACLAARDWNGAMVALTAAKDLADEAEAEAIARHMEAVAVELRYVAAIDRATAELGAEHFEEALASAREALGLKPGDEKAEEIVLAARGRLGPEAELANSVGMTFVLIPAGEFVMGSRRGDPDEQPQRSVALNDYYVSRCEVTNAQFERFDPSHKYRRTQFSPDDDMPVVNVSWNEAANFCRWLSEKEGVAYRLPTEAEWEKAARGADQRAFPWGGDSPSGRYRHCNFAPERNEETWAEDGHRYAAPVGSFQDGASPYGVQDLAGNVWEWCLDWYSRSYYSKAEDVNPMGPPTGRQHVLRGGSFGNAADQVRCANRTAAPPDMAEGCVGFRCVRMLDPIFAASSEKSE